MQDKPIYDFGKLKKDCRTIIEKELGQPDSHTDIQSKYKCPFHSEKTASFVVWEDHWTCFGACGITGDTVDFIQRRHHMTISQAMKYLGAEMSDSAATEEYRRQREAERQVRLAEQQVKRNEFTKSHIWEQYHQNLTATARSLWSEAGIPIYFQDMWRLGFVADHAYSFQDEFLHSPALTIPYSTFINGRSPEYYTMQYRLLKPANSGDKYRFEKDLGSGPWIARPDLHPGEKLTRVLLAEGMKKGGVAYIALEGCMQVLGAPSKTNLASSVEALSRFDEVYIWLDPDVVIRPRNATADWRPPDEMLCEKLPQARYIRYPKKLDDAVIAHHLNSGDLLSIMRYGSRR